MRSHDLVPDLACHATSLGNSLHPATYYIVQFWLISEKELMVCFDVMFRKGLNIEK